MKQACTAALETANRRGLGNSSMTARASETAAIGAATPIATQEASQVAGKILAAQQAGHNADDTRAHLAAAEQQLTAEDFTNLSGQRSNALSNTLTNEKSPSTGRRCAVLDRPAVRADRRHAAAAL